MNADGDLSAREALEAIGRVRRKVGRSATWLGWLLIVWGVAAFFYWNAMYFGSEPLQSIAGAAWVVMSLVSLVFVYMRGVYGRGSSCREQFTVTLSWLATMFAAAAFAHVMPEGPTGWWIAGGVAAALVAAAPVSYFGWRLRPWAGER
ncbi:hypothetical protein Skr01_72350 [Sphaerisporangium krabiense]|uniref:Uncharacterized protein n=1 Tax=Sphaerisporangium krabiense TaxID=763782 RepID=A0A7W9DRU9_9ACTN|nr:hypothetical protein [Sphaerisporangium krabiense]MBB5628509.1 hypothetical protein [Sphaerisporangium krabiense]GII67150.1 hypothetical protein Skr01_72350 [Sphaerisporangium krabiense]